MPGKHFQRSRLNSLNDGFELKLSKFPKVEMKIEEVQPLTSGVELGSSITKESGLEIFDYEDDICEADLSPDIQISLSRTSLLILDYHQFKAARCIQRFVRGWLARRRYKKLLWASLIIQKEWRRFYGIRCYYRRTENILQNTIERRYYQAAVKIQSVWRGWLVRELIHDHVHLVRLQVTAGEDLLHCVAFKLHHLLRTHQIPGVYSLRNSNAFSKVESLLASLSFKHCIERVRKAHDFRNNQIREAKKTFTKSAYATKVPFAGPNINNICAQKCLPLYSEKDADRKMSKILRMFEEACTKDPRIKQRHKFSQSFRGICKPRPCTFCGDVVHSMKKWKILEKNHKEIDPNIFQRPENVENFLHEIKSWWSFMHANCNAQKECAEDNANKDLRVLQHPLSKMKKSKFT